MQQMPGTVNAGTGSGKKKESNAAVIVIVILVTVIVVLGIVVACLLLLGKKDKAETEDNNSAAVATTTAPREVANSARFVLDEQSAENAMEEMRQEVEEGMFECSMSTEWTFEDGNSESRDAYVANSSNNTHPIYFDVVLDGSEEVIYSSPVIPVGGELTNFKLDTPLSAGNYKAICKYSLLKDEESQEVTSSANFVVRITVQN